MIFSIRLSISVKSKGSLNKLLWFNILDYTIVSLSSSGATVNKSNKKPKCIKYTEKNL